MEKPNILELPVTDGTAPPEEDDAPAESRESVEEYARRLATEAGQAQKGWKGSYQGMTHRVGNFFRDQMNELIEPVAEQVSTFGKTVRNELNNGPEGIEKQANTKLKQLRNEAEGYKNSRADFMAALKNLQKKHPDLTEDNVRKTKVKTTGSWFMFFGLLLCVIVGESVINMALLASALEGGLVEAFFIAFAVSAINVGAIGIFWGHLCARLHGIKQLWSKIALTVAAAAWAAVMVTLNVFVGRHREGYALDIEAKEEAAEAAAAAISEGLFAPVVAENIDKVPFNPLDWHLQSVLFFILGMALCCGGFRKGFILFHPGEKIKPNLDELDEKKKAIESGIQSLPSKSKAALDALQKRVSEEIATLSGYVQKARNELESYEMQWETIVGIMESEFVDSYNQAHPTESISEETLRSSTVAPQFPATPMVRETIQAGQKIVSDYKTGGESDFYNRLASAEDAVSDSSDKYWASASSLMRDSRA